MLYNETQSVQCQDDHNGFLNDAQVNLIDETQASVVIYAKISFYSDYLRKL